MANSQLCKFQPNSNSSTHDQIKYGIKDFKEEYVKFGNWPELNYMQQKQLKKKCSLLERQSRLHKQQIDVLKQANTKLQNSISSLQRKNSDNQCIKRTTCFSNKKENNRYTCKNCSSNSTMNGYQWSQQTQIQNQTQNNPNVKHSVYHHQRSQSHN